MGVNIVDMKVLHNPQFQEMITAINRAHISYKAPSYDKARTVLLNKCVRDMEKGLTSSRGAMFMYAIDFSGVEKTGTGIANFLLGAIETIGSNVLQVVTDNVANYKVVGKEVEKLRWEKITIPLHCLGFALSPRFYDKNYLEEMASGEMRRKTLNLDKEVLVGVIESFKRITKSEEEEHTTPESISIVQLQKVCKCLRTPLDVRKLFKDIFEKQKQDKVERSHIPHVDDDVVDINDEDEEEAGEVPFLLGKRAISSSKSTLHNKKVKGALDTHFKSSNETGKKKKGYLLEKEHTKKLLILNETQKKAIGCSLMADGWRDRKGRALINFLVNTPRGSMFLEFVDASSYSHTRENLFKLFDYFIKETRPDHGVQIVTDSVANNVLAGKMVEAKYPHIYWTLCVTHCIGLMLEDIFKVTHLKKTLDKAIAANTYIYNRTLLLNMLRDFMGQRDMIRPAKTRFATALLTLNCFRSHKTSLKKLFTSEAWNKSKFKGEEGGTQCVTTTFSTSFWINIEIAVKVGEPLLAVLRLVDSERKPAMRYIYEAMDRAKEQIAYSFNNKFNKYKAFFKFIDDKWNCQLHQDLHAAGPI
uniref:DUF659 domain-containing protein n=1 Tax=Lactuca sativa TaxID=4236 RepID=A0A9R1VS12_LACSA|nr:hypothetical protein LSAT_V11C400211820 [Lactuca sativa]